MSAELSASSPAALLRLVHADVPIGALPGDDLRIPAPPRPMAPVVNRPRESAEIEAGFGLPIVLGASGVAGFLYCAALLIGLTG